MDFDFFAKRSCQLTLTFPFGKTILTLFSLSVDRIGGKNIEWETLRVNVKIEIVHHNFNNSSQLISVMIKKTINHCHACDDI
jgi:hypothetical protein